MCTENKICGTILKQYRTAFLRPLRFYYYYYCYKGGRRGGRGNWPGFTPSSHIIMMTLSIGSSSQTSLNSGSYGSNQPSEISTHNKSRYFYTRGLKHVLRGLVSDKGQNICQIVSLSYDFTHKPSNTHRKTGAGFIQHIRSAQSQLLNGWGDENGKCNWILVSWVVCTENKICETILKQYRPKFLRPLRFLFMALLNIYFSVVKVAP